MLCSQALQSWLDASYFLYHAQRFISASVTLLADQVPMFKFDAISKIAALAITLAVASPAAHAIDLSQGFSGGNVGEVGGAVVGGVGGNYLAKKAKLGKTGQLAATIGGTIAGGMLGGSLGKQLDASSRARAETAQMTAISTGTRQSWKSPSYAGAGAGAGAGNYGAGNYGAGTYGAKTWSSDAGRTQTAAANATTGSTASGSIEPGNPYQTETGICRDYVHNITIGGRKETARGIACRNPDGSWRVAS
jgi:surface antigen